MPMAEVQARLSAGAPVRLQRGLVAAQVLAATLAAAAIGFDLGQRPAHAASEATGARLLAGTSMLISGITTFVAAWERRHRDLRRRSWALALLAVGSAIVYGGQAIGYAVTASWSGPFVVWVEIWPLLIGAPFLAVGLVVLAWPPGMERRETWFVASDGLTAAVWLAVFWLLIVVPAWQPADSSFESLFVVVDPWIQYAGLVAVLVIAATSRRTGALPIEQLILLQCTMLIFLVSDTAGDVIPQADRQSVITWSILGYVVAAAVFTRFCFRPALQDDPLGSARLRDTWSVVMPILPLPLAAVTILVYRLVNGLLPPLVITLITVGVLMVVAAAAVMRLVLYRDIRAAASARVATQLHEGTRSGWFAALVGDSRDLVTVVNRDGRIIYQTPSVVAMLGYSPDSLAGTYFADLLAEEGRTDVARRMLRATHDPEDRGPYELLVIDARGYRHDMEAQISPLDASGFDGFVITIRDITDRRRLRAELAATVARDGLTGLPNREGFLARLREQISAVEPHGLAVVLVDLEGFREINDSRGHDAGDEVLRVMAGALDRMPGNVRAVGRVGSDEFGLVVVSDRVERDVGDVDRDLRDALGGILLHDGERLHVDAAVGYVVLTEVDRSAAELLEQADLALAAARTSRAHGVVRYERDMRSALVSRLRAEADLRDALDHDRLIVHYQPAVRISDGALVSVEALARLVDPRGEIVMPATFIPRAESLGLIHRVGQRVMRIALSDHNRIEEVLGRGLQVWVNVSARQLDENLPTMVAEALAATGVSASSLGVELTESVVAENEALATTLLGELRGMGCGVALDDFGTGYSSLASLATLPIDLLKIDKSFVGRLGSSPESFALVRTLLQLGQTLRLQTVAEGVETVEQADILRGMTCDRAQGYLFGRPMPLAELLAALRIGRGILPVSTGVRRP